MGLRAGLLLKVGFGVGFGVGIRVGETTGLGVGRGVYLGITGVRLPVITSAPFSTVKSMQVLVQSAAIEKVFKSKASINKQITRIFKILKESSKRFARHFGLSLYRMSRCWRPLESLTQLHFLDLIAKH